MHYCKTLLLVLLCLLSAGSVHASHFFGVDLFYTHVLGNTYKVTMVAFGDCSGIQFPTFPTDRPRIYILQGATQWTTAILDIEPPTNGVEVTEGCPADLARTTCKDPNGTVPGVKKFVYSREFTLPNTAADWRFVYRGETSGSTTAGRSFLLTNVAPAGIIGLEATLDNRQQNNSSPRFNSIATQFYCSNTPTEYNPAAVDSDGDSLVYELIPGLDPTGQLAYASGYSGSNPLAAATGTFKFNTATGLLAFTPSQLQKSLVVYRISEYRNGVLLGTVTREMTIVVLPCQNAAPVGYITNVSGAKQVDPVTVKTCTGNHEVAFDINPTDSDNHIISMTPGNLPTGATLNITNNNTTNPTSRFVWNMPTLAYGDYSFFINYADDGCPPAQQKQTYIIRIQPDTIYADVTDATCTSPGSIKVTTPQDWVPWSLNVYNGPGTLYSLQNLQSVTWKDAADAGKYTIQATNAMGCVSDALVEVPSICYVADLPNAFSPNGDGKNDILYVKGLNINNMLLRIYNRWGQIVFESQDVNSGWDGTFNGDDAPMEAYAFVLSVVFRSGEGFQKRGNITLLR